MRQIDRSVPPSSRPVSSEMSAHVTVIHFDGLSPMCRSARSSGLLLDDAPFGSDHRRGASCSDCRPSGHDRGAEIQRLEIGECLRLAHLCGDVAIEFRAGGAIQADAALAEFDAITVTRSCELHSRRQVFLMVARFQPRR